MNTPDISVVVPVYLGEPFLEELVERVERVITKMGLSTEIILVNDSSPDNSIDKIQQLCKAKQFVKGVILSRNFGQHYAIHAGLEASKGKWVVVMDCDLQDRPEEIEHLYQKAKEGADIVLAQRVVRQDGFLKKLSSKLFYTAFGYLTETEQDSSIANFGIYHRKVVLAILSMKDHIRFFPTMVQWVGFNRVKLPVKHNERAEGESSYSWRSLLKLAFNNIIAFSDKPLRITVKFGILVSSISALIGFYYLSLYLRGEIVVLGFASLIISIWFLSGVIIFILGISGIYIGKMFEQTKDRPIYIVDKTINIDD